VLVRAHDGRVDQGIFVVRIAREPIEDPLPDACLAPTRVTEVYDAEVTEALRQVSPRDAGAVAIEHGVDEEAVVTGRHTHMACSAGQQVLDAGPLVVSEGVSAVHGSSA
jgi:hypothetical protein